MAHLVGEVHARRDLDDHDEPEQPIAHARLDVAVAVAVAVEPEQLLVIDDGLPRGEEGGWSAVEEGELWGKDAGLPRGEEGRWRA